MKCKNCGHLLHKVTHQKGTVSKLFNGEIVHKNGKREWAVYCRVNKCGCLKPEVI